MTTSGMNLGEVRQLAEQLRLNAENLRTIVSTIDGRVSYSTWIGPDADRFRQWWPGHRRLILEAADRVHGLGQSARNNADEQERISGASGSAGAAGIAPGGGGLVGALGLLAAGGAQFVASVGAWRNLIKDPIVLSAAEASLRRSVGREISGATNWGPVPASYRAGVEAYAEASASRNVTLDSSGLAASAQAGAAIGARAEVQGQVGNRYLGGDVGAQASVEAAARAGGDVKIGPTGATGSLGADIGARAEVGADARAHISGVEAGASIKGYAGLTAQAEITGSVSLDAVKARVDLGAAVGFGGGVSFDVEVKPAQLLEDAGNLVEQWTKGWPR